MRAADVTGENITEKDEAARCSQEVFCTTSAAVLERPRRDTNRNPRGS